MSKENLGELIAGARNGKGLTNEEAAEKLGVSIMYVNRIEKGESQNISLSIAARLSELYEIPLEDISQAQFISQIQQAQQNIEAWEGKIGMRRDIRLDEMSQSVFAQYHSFLETVASRH